MSLVGDQTRKDDKGDQPSGGETTWTNTERHDMAEDSTRGDGMLRPSPNHGTQRLPNDDDVMSTALSHTVSGRCCIDGSSVHQPIICCSRPTLQALAPIQSGTPHHSPNFVLPVSLHFLVTCYNPSCQTQ